MSPSSFHVARKFAATRFGDIAYVEQGNGPAALFLHGLPLCGYAWTEVIQDVSAVRRCIAPDLLGLGYSRIAPGHTVSFGDQANMLIGLLDALNVEQVDVVGNDTGGGIAQILAASYPHRIRTLSLTNCEVHDLWPNALLRGFYEGVAAGVVIDGFKQMLTDPALAAEQLGALVYEQPSFFNAERVETYLRPIVESDDRIRSFQALCDWHTNRAQLMAAATKLRHSTIPAQLVWGDDDEIFDGEPSVEWFKSHLGSLEKVTRVQGAKLFFPEERPELVSLELRGFWAKHQ